MSFPTEKPYSSNKKESNSIQDDQIKRAQLKKQFRSTRKGDDETIESYVKRLKSIADSLAAIDSPISDSDMVLQLLAGLPREYEPGKKLISSKSPLPTFEEACSTVYMLEGILLQDHHESSAFITLKKVATISFIGGTIVGAAATFPTVAGAVGAVSAVSASRMIAIGSMSAVGAVAGWKIWKTQKEKLFMI